MSPRSHHEIAADRTHTVWDNAIAPVLEIEPGETVELAVTDASGGSSTATRPSRTWRTSTSRA